MGIATDSICLYSLQPRSGARTTHGVVDETFISNRKQGPELVDTCVPWQEQVGWYPWTTMLGVTASAFLYHHIDHGDQIIG